MDKEKFESQKAFAGEKKPSMHRRCVDNDYTERRMYMITMATEGRKPLFGQVVGHSKAVEPSPEAPHIELSPLGKAVEQIWNTISEHHPEVKVVALQMMPDHLHAILFVTKKMEKPLGSNNGLLFEKNFNDQILLREGQLECWLNYLKDNPRRLLMKREKPDLFRVQRGLTYAGVNFSAIGNRFLLERPQKLQVQCSRKMTEAEIQTKLEECLQAAVLVSPSISPGEKAIMRAAFMKGLPLIYLQENGFTDLAKPGGKRMEACARGQLLILAPWEHHNEKRTIMRGQCLELNEMARAICEEGAAVECVAVPQQHTKLSACRSSTCPRGSAGCPEGNRR